MANYKYFVSFFFGNPQISQIFVPNQIVLDRDDPIKSARDIQDVQREILHIILKEAPNSQVTNVAIGNFIRLDS
jgi:hypothetical protein